MNGLNRILFAGKLVDRPRFGKTTRGICFAEFLVESIREWTFQGKNRFDKTTASCQAWHNLAELMRNFKQGDVLVLDGRLHNRKWYNPDGSASSKLVIIPDIIWRCAANGSPVEDYHADRNET